MYRQLSVAFVVCISLLGFTSLVMAAPRLPRVRVATKDGRAIGEAVDGQLIVTFKGDTPMSRRLSLIHGIGASAIKWFPQINMAVIQLPPTLPLVTARQKILSDASVKNADANYICRPLLTPNDPQFRSQTAPPQIKAPEAWDKQTGSSSVVVAVIDTGIFLSHEDFGGDNRSRIGNRIFRNVKEIPGNGIDDDRNGFIDDLNGWDFVDDDADPNPSSDAEQHGTHVTGIIAATGNNSKGIAGVDWACKVMPLRVLSATAGGETDKVIDALLYAANNGARVINLSIGYFDPQTLAPFFFDVFDSPISFAFDQKDVVIVAAAGNSDINLSLNQMSPVCNDVNDNKVLGVSAVDATDVKALFSNFHDPLDTFIDVAAPGVNILSTLYPRVDPLDNPTGALYGNISGTSQAAPHVAGMAALLRAQFPGDSAREIREKVRQSVDNIDLANPTLQPGALGTGRINLLNAFEVVIHFGASAALLGPRLNEVVYNLSPTLFMQFSHTDSQGNIDDPFDYSTLQLYITGINSSEAVTGTQVVKNGVPVGQVIDGNVVGTYGSLVVDQPNSQARFLPIALSKDRHVVNLEIRDQAGVESNSDPITATVSFSISQRSLSPGTQMFSVPYQVRNNQTQFVLGTLSLPIMARWDPASLNYHYFFINTFDPFVSQLRPGKAYWLSDSQPRPLTIEAEDTSVFPQDQFAFTQETRSDGNLSPGWHQIASPYPFDINIANVLFEKNGSILPMLEAIEEGLVGTALWSYSTFSNEYSLEDPNTGLLKAFNGYWLLVKQTVKMFVLPVRNTTRGKGSSGRSSTERPSDNSNGWQLQIAARAGESVASQNFIGFAQDASDRADRRDVMQPPTAPGNRLRVSFPRPQWDSDSGSYARDIRRLPLRQTQTFDMEVTADMEDAPVTVSWDNLTRVPKNVRLTLVDQDTARRVYMRTARNYSFNSGQGGTRRFQLIVDPNPGPAMRVSNITVVNGGRAGSGLSAQYGLTQSATVEVCIRSLSGRIVRAFPVGTGKTGINLLRWDLRDAMGKIVPRGTYLLEIVASTDENQVGRGVRTINLR